MSTKTAPQTPAIGGGFILILGETTSGGRFRPSDWCDRLHSTLRALDEDEYEECVRYVHLVNSGKGRGVLISHELKEANSQLYQFFMSFVKSNELSTSEFTTDSWDAETRNNGVGVASKAAG